MALTRTKLSQADTSVVKLQDPITVLNNSSTEANVDIGFLLNRDGGTSSNVALLWSESSNSFVVAFTTDTGITNSNININSHANVTAGTVIVNSLRTDNFLFSNGNPFSAPASSYASTFVADNLSSGNAVFATARITGNLQVEGNIFTIGQQNLSISDAVIDLHTQANLAPWTFNDGKDIGLKFHYYDYQDEHAFLGRANDTGYLEWYDSGRESGNVFTGNTYGTIKAGGLILANSTISSNNTTGALVVTGGAGIAGRLNVGGNIIANSGAASSGTTTGALIVRGGAGISGDTYISGILDAGSIQNTPIGTVTPNSGYFNDLNNTLTLKSGGNIVAYSGTSSTNTTTGALVVVGGTAISEALNVGATIRAQGNVVAASGTASTNTTTGALVVVGGAGISGNVVSGALYTSGLFWAGNNQSISGPAVGASGTIQFNNGGILDATNIVYDSASGNVVFTDSTSSSSTTTGAVVVIGGVGVGGNVVASGLVGTHYGSLFLGTTQVDLARTSASQVLNGVGIDGTATTATTAINTQVTSNISSGTAYVAFVNATAGNAAQNVNTSLTYNPNSGNLRAFGLITDTAVYWAGNGAVYGNRDDTLRANVGAYQTYANANVVAIQANLGAFQTFSNANAASLATSINTINANTGAYQTYANANVVAIQANLGSYQNYANTKIGTNNNSNLVVLSSTVSTSATTGALVVNGGVGISGNVFTAGWIVPTANTTQNLGSVTNWWGTIYGVSQQARYADLAENYVADTEYLPGTVLIFGGELEVTVTNITHNTAVAGVVSTNPAYLMNAASGNVSVAFTGRVPCFVKGPVTKGTVLVTSDIPGVAEALHQSLYRPGCVLGKSLEEIVDTSIKTIEVVVGRF